MTADPDHRQDSDLFAELARGDSAALATLLRRYWVPVVRYAVSILGDADDASDAAQEAFARLWVRREAWSEITSARALLIRLVRNAAFDEVRRRRRRRQSGDAGVAARVADPRPDPVEQLATRELTRMIERAVAALPERRREVFRLSREAGLSYDEIASVLGLSAQTVANHMSLALADLRRAIDASVPTD